LNAPNLLLHLRRRVRVAIFRRASRAGHQDTGSERSADDDADATPDAFGHAGMQARLVEQRIGHGDQHEIEVDDRRHLLQRRTGIDPHADRLDIAASLQLFERLDPGIDEVALAIAELLPMVDLVQVVDDERIDRVDVQPLQAVLVGPHNRVVTIVETVLEFEPAGPCPGFEAGRVERPLQHPPDLRRQHIFGALPATQRMAETVLGQAEAIPWGAVEKADAGVPCRVDRRGRVRFVDETVEFTQMRRTVAENRYRQGRPADLAPLEFRWHRPQTSREFYAARR